MLSALLNENFDLLMDAPESVARMRELILQLAVMGKLVPQNKNNEPASELLKRIQAEKVKLIEEGKIKRPKELPPISEAEKPFEVPDGWEWVRFNDYCDIQGGGQPPKSRFESALRPGYVRLLQIRDFGARPVPVYVPEATVSRFCDEDDVMIARYGASVGKIFLGKSGAYNVALTKVIYPRSLFSQLYLYHLLRSPYLQSFFQGMTRSAQAGFNKGDLSSVLFPLPPLAEQKRIVEKVGRLMALCDELEKRQQERDSVQISLNGSAFQSLTTAEDKKSFQVNLKRVRDHFDLLVSRPENVKTVRDTILQLAVMGKLVPQDKNDEPASEVLKRIGERKSAAKGQQDCGSHELRPRLPVSWAYVDLNTIIAELDAGWSPQCESSPRKSERDWAILKTTAVQSLYYQPMHNKLLPKNLEPRPQYEVKNGDILVTRAGPQNRVGIACVVDESPKRLMISDKILRFQLEKEVLPAFCALALTGPDAHNQIEMSKSGMASSQMNISQEKLRKIQIPMPPLAEQKRIVARVDGLMALCDGLEEGLSKSQADGRRLLESVVAEMAG
ncbi:MAG: restriction endonuclease subunit S [Leptospiraceae bacterium]|nr:restriction endonuclease subunit S [Leptospiraceae bacterium]